MTRINCIPVSELTDKHLLAEYRELPRISQLSWDWAMKNKLITDKLDSYTVYHEVFIKTNLPQTYRLGTGHVKFFYDKGEYLKRRFEDEIVPEMQRRGFKTNFTKYRTHPDRFNRDWKPDEDAMELNRQRIKERLGGK